MFKLKDCRFVIIPILNRKLKKPKNGKKEYTGDHWGRPVLLKSSASSRLHDTIHEPQSFDPLMTHTLLLANPIW